MAPPITFTGSEDKHYGHLFTEAWNYVLYPASYFHLKSPPPDSKAPFFNSHLHWLPSQDEEVLRSHHHEAHELVAEDLLDLVRLGTAENMFLLLTEVRVLVHVNNSHPHCVARLGQIGREIFPNLATHAHPCWGSSSLFVTCLTAMLTLTELMEPSMRTFSFSLRLIITGWSRSSLLLLWRGRIIQL